MSAFAPMYTCTASEAVALVYMTRHNLTSGEADEASEMEQDSDAEADAISSLLQAVRCGQL